MSRAPAGEALQTTEEAPLTRHPAREQGRILAARYRAVMMGDWATVLLLVAQAPLIGWLCTVVWGSIETDTPSLYFVLSLSAVWFGCINACREVVKERAILERERSFGLSLTAYLWSKLSVLGALGLVQVLALQLAVEWEIALRGPMLLQTLGLWGASLAGTALGLLVSSLARSQEWAVAAVPLLIIPQILFSEFAIPKEQFGDVVMWAERAMPVKWSYLVFTEGAAMEPDWLVVIGALLVLVLFTGALSGAAIAALVPRRES